MQGTGTLTAPLAQALAQLVFPVCTVAGPAELTGCSRWVSVLLAHGREA